MRAEITVQALAHAAVAVDYVTQWASYLVAYRAAEAATLCN